MAALPAGEQNPNQPLVSVIVPVYNQRDFLPAVIACLEGQTYPHIEAIYVDDGSTDGSGEMLDRLAGASVRVIHQHNQGLSAARNTGLRNARGDLVQFLDADDLIAEDKIAHDAAYLVEHPEVDLVTCEVSYFRESLRWQRPAEAVRPFDDLLVALLGGNRLQPNGPLVRRAALSAVGTFNVNMPTCEDWDYWLRFAAAGRKAAFVPGVRAFYRLHGEQMSGDPERMLTGARMVLARARRIEKARRSEARFALALLAGHTTWSLKARAAGHEELAEQLRQYVADWPEILPEGFVPGEYTAAEHLGLWTRVLWVFGDREAKFERARREWQYAAERIGRRPNAAGVRALLQAQQALECSPLRDRAGEVIGQARSLAAELHGQRDLSTPRRGPGAHIEEVLGLLRQKSLGTILIYGAGQHTRWLLTEFDLGDFQVAGLMDDDAKLWGSSVLGLPVVSPRSAAQTRFDAVLISSDQYEARLAERARRIFPLARLYRLYDSQLERPAVPTQ